MKQKNGRTERYLYIESAVEIVACAKVQTVEFHGWGSRAGEVETPDRLVIDLDPGEGVGFEQVKSAAFQLHRSFDALRLESFALLTGGKGIHVVVPLVREIEALEPCQGTVLTDRRVGRPYALQGGDASAPGVNAIRRRSGQVESIPGKAIFQLQTGDVLQIKTPGGGGWGQP